MEYVHDIVIAFGIVGIAAMVWRVLWLERRIDKLEADTHTHKRVPRRNREAED